MKIGDKVRIIDCDCIGTIIGVENDTLFIVRDDDGLDWTSPAENLEPLGDLAATAVIIH